MGYWKLSKFGKLPGKCFRKGSIHIFETFPWQFLEIFPGGFSVESFLGLVSGKFLGESFFVFHNSRHIPKV